METKSVLLLLLAVGVLSEGPDNHGREFILSFIDNTQYYNLELELFFTTVSNTPAVVNVTTPLYDPSFIEAFNVTRGEIVKILLHYGLRGTGVELTDKTVWIQATEEVVVYCVNKDEHSTDAYVGLPVDALGKDYYTISSLNSPAFAISAFYDDTTVSITFTDENYVSVYYNGRYYSQGSTLTLTMNRFQSFHCIQDAYYTDDLTGTHITSDKNIGVVSGNKRCAVPYTGSTSDHLTEMLFPVETWGKRFFTYSTPDRYVGDYIRIIAAETATDVNILQSQANTTYTLNAGDFVELDMTTDDLATIESNKGIMVGIFAKSYGAHNLPDGPHEGDPAFSLLVTAGLYLADYTWSTVQLPDNTDFNNKITILIKDSWKDGLRLDNANINATWLSIPYSGGYVTTWIYVDPESHNLYHIDPTKTFMAIATGTELYNSYAFSAGQRMTQINMPCNDTVTVAADMLDNDCDGFIDEETANGVDDDGDGLIDEDLAMAPRVDGGWGDWGNWSACSVTCLGTGVQVRTRLCNNPEPANNGIDCVGTSQEYLSCNNTALPCGVLGEWSPWSACSVTCNEGWRTRERNCTDIVTGLPDTCIGELNQTEICGGPLPGVCTSSQGSTYCTCDWGYTGNGTVCDACVANYTGCYCEQCKVDLIGYDTDCSTPCYHGYPSVTGGNVCECYQNITYGWWQGGECSFCRDGFTSADCTVCAPGYVGTDHSSIPCSNGYLYYDYDGTTGDADVVPDVTCVVTDRSGQSSVWFGYSSFNSVLVVINIGEGNNVTGGTAVNQMVEFRPGYHAFAFYVQATNLSFTDVTWTLTTTVTSYTVTANANTTECSGTPSVETLATVNISDILGYCKCNPGYYGASCTYECVGGTSTPCSGVGTCGVIDGRCTCPSRYTGSVVSGSAVYTAGYQSNNGQYACENCTQGWYGDDCSTALLDFNISSVPQRNGSVYYSTVASSGILTLDGATLEIVQPGAYRFQETNDIIVDGYFVPCNGRYDCHTLQEVAFFHDNVTISIAVNASGSTVIQSSAFSVTDLPFTQTIGNLTFTQTSANVVTLSTLDGSLRYLLTNVQGELMLGVEVTVPTNSTSGVTGLLGNADDDWVNDIASSVDTSTYTSSDLTATAKAVNAQQFYLNSSQTVVTQSDLAITPGSGGYSVFVDATSNGTVTGLSLPNADVLSMEMWVRIPSTAGTEVVLAEVETDRGLQSISVINGYVALDGWCGTYTSPLAVPNDTWVYVSAFWDANNGSCSLSVIDDGVPNSVTSMNSTFSGTIGTLNTASFGGGNSTTGFYLDYVRMFNTMRTTSEMVADYKVYTDEFIPNQIFLAMFDDIGSTTSFNAYTMPYDIVSSHTGNMVNSTWHLSTAPVDPVLTAADLPAVVSDAAAVAACEGELNSQVFLDYCKGMSSVKQMLMENCISDFRRTGNENIVKIAGSAFAFLCQGVTQTDECQFVGYFDFCPPIPTTTPETTTSAATTRAAATTAAQSTGGGAGGGGSMIPIIAGAVGGLIAVSALSVAAYFAYQKWGGGRWKKFDTDTSEDSTEQPSKTESSKGNGKPNSTPIFVAPAAGLAGLPGSVNGGGGGGPGSGLSGPGSKGGPNGAGPGRKNKVQFSIPKQNAGPGITNGASAGGPGTTKGGAPNGALSYEGAPGSAKEGAPTGAMPNGGEPGTANGGDPNGGMPTRVAPGIPTGGAPWTSNGSFPSSAAIGLPASAIPVGGLLAGKIPTGTAPNSLGTPATANGKYPRGRPGGVNGPTTDQPGGPRKWGKAPWEELFDPPQLPKGEYPPAPSKPPPLQMREKGPFSLGDPTPIDPLHKGRWTPYGYLPGAMTLEGVPFKPPDQMGVDKYGEPVAEPSRGNTPSSITVSIDSNLEGESLTPAHE